MAKRPTPKKRRAKSKGRTQHSAYEMREIRRLINRMNSPYAPVAGPKDARGKALKGITKIKA